MGQEMMGKGDNEKDGIFWHGAEWRLMDRKMIDTSFCGATFRVIMS